MGGIGSGKESKFVVATKLRNKLSKLGVPQKPRDIRARQYEIERSFLAGHIHNLTAKFLTDSNSVMLKSIRAEDAELQELREMASSLDAQMKEGMERQIRERQHLGPVGEESAQATPETDVH